MKKIAYDVESNYENQGWDTTNYTSLETIQAARNTMASLTKYLEAEGRTKTWKYRIVKVTREVVK